MKQEGLSQGDQDILAELVSDLAGQVKVERDVLDASIKWHSACRGAGSSVFGATHELHAAIARLVDWKAKHPK